jgi:hypothetical protein
VALDGRAGQAREQRMIVSQQRQLQAGPAQDLPELCEHRAEAQPNLSVRHV